MGEIRLICPGCEAEYRLPEDAIPAAGREVECTACGRVWQAARDGDEIAPAGPTGFGAAPGPQRQDLGPQPAAPLSRRLPDSVLNILREEVEHERRARMAEDDAFASPAPGTDAPQPAPPRAAPISGEGEWPATTVTAADDMRGRASAAGVTTRFPRAMLGDPEVRQAHDHGRVAVPDKIAMNGRTEQVQAAVAPLLPGYAAATDTVPETAPDESRPTVAAPIAGDHAAAYRMGLGVAAMIAAVCLALYLLAPGLADAGPLGEALVSLRGLVDHGREWLQTRVGLAG